MPCEHFVDIANQSIFKLSWLKSVKK